MQFTKLKLACKDASVWIKIGAGVVGLLAATLWYFSSQTPTAADGASLNANAALTTGIAMLLQSAAAMIDAWIPPSATWD